MQRLDEEKRKAVLSAAAKLFAQRPFHEVRLDDVAALARVGKGTLYIYFKSKEDLYISLIRDGFRGLVGRLNAQIESAPKATDAWETLALIIREFVGWATQHPQLFDLMRAAQAGRGPDKELRETRRALGALIESVIRRGIRAGEIVDPHPELTGQFVPACVRAALVHGPKDAKPDAIVKHILRVLSQGIRRRTV
jgi:AcrR family transcriptional regulator